MFKHLNIDPSPAIAPAHGLGALAPLSRARGLPLHRQVEESRGQVDELVAALIEFRTAQVTVVEERKAQTQANDARTELAKQALTQIGQAAQAFLVGRGIPPELTDVLGSISNSPELMAAMNDPEVRELMKDPNNLSALAGMLRHATATAKAARTGTETP